MKDIGIEDEVRQSELRADELNEMVVLSRELKKRAKTKMLSQLRCRRLSKRIKTQDSDI